MIKTVVFDIGGVLVDWNPRYIYRTICDDEREIEHFLTNVCTFDWNHSLDLGRPWEEAKAELVAKFPEKEDWIELYRTKWIDMFAGPIHESVDILMEIKRKGFPLYALSNWGSQEGFDLVRKEICPFFGLFDGVILSGVEKIAKPDPAIYKLLLDRFNLNPRETVFIDDRLDNVQAARNLGIEAIHFTTPSDLESHLVTNGIFAGDEEDNEEEFQGCGGGCTCHPR